MVLKQLTGKCLVAAPSVTGGMFERSVVLIYEQSSSGVAGIILNHKSNFTTHDLAESKGYNAVAPVETIYTGGPVNRNAVFMLHDSGWYSRNTMTINQHLSLSSDDIMIHKYLQGNTPRLYRFCAGAAVWSAAQLSSEFDRGSWLQAELSMDQIFNYNGLTQWDMSVECAVKSTIDMYI